MVETSITPGQKAILEAMAREGRYDEIAGIYVTGLHSGDVACARYIVRNYIHLMGPGAVATMELATGLMALAVAIVEGDADTVEDALSMLGEGETLH